MRLSSLPLSKPLLATRVQLTGLPCCCARSPRRVSILYQGAGVQVAIERRQEVMNSLLLLLPSPPCATWIHVPPSAGGTAPDLSGATAPASAGVELAVDDFVRLVECATLTRIGDAKSGRLASSRYFHRQRRQPVHPCPEPVGSPSIEPARRIRNRKDPFQFPRSPKPLMLTCRQPGTPGANFWMRWLLRSAM